MTLSLFDNRLAPLTYSIGFLNAPIDTVRQAFLTYLARLGPQSFSLPGSLEDNLLHLQPLPLRSTPRILLTSTIHSNWTACFDGDPLGQGVAQKIAFVSRNHLKVRGYFVGCSLPSSVATESLGGRHFRVLGPEYPLGEGRSIDLIETNPGRWYFEVGGDPQPYENLDAYTNRRRTQRLTDTMLLDYTAAVGLHPWDEDFYTTPTYLITNTEPPLLSYTLEQAQTELGIPPQEPRPKQSRAVNLLRLLRKGR